MRYLANSRALSHASPKEELRRRDLILEAVNFAAERFLSSKSWQENLPQVLARLGAANDASRAYVFETVRDLGGAWLGRQHSIWNAPDAPLEPRAGALDVFSFGAAGLGRWEEELSHGRTLCGAVSDFPPDERSFLAAMNTLSTVLIPVFVGSRWWGYIGLDNCASERVWQAAEIDALKVAAGILGAVIQRQQSEELAGRMYEAEREQRRVAQVLHEVGSAFSASLSFDGILDQILDELPRIVPYDAAYLMLVTPGFGEETLNALAARRAPIEKPTEMEQKAVVARQRGYEHYGDRRLQGFPALTFKLNETPALKWMAESRQPLVVSDTRTASGLVHLLDKERFCSWAAAPIILQGQAIAFFVMEKTEPGFFRSEQTELLGLFASQAGLALQNARLFAETLGALEREQNLNQVTWAISSALKLPAILQNVVRLAVELCGADAGALAILSPDGSSLTYPYLYNLPVSLSTQSDPQGLGLAWNVIADKKPYLLENYGSLPNAIPAWVDAGVHAVVSVPLIAGDTCLGCLGLFKYNPDRRFNSRDQALVESVGRQAGVAIQNARLYEAAERRARESETLRLAVGEVTSALEFDRVLNRILKYLRKVVPFDCSVVFLTEGDQVRAVAGRGLSPHNTIINHTFPGTNALFQEIKRSRGRPLILEDAQTDPRFEKWGNAIHSHGWMGLRLRAHGDLIGYLTIDSKSVGAYTPQDAALVQAFADEVAMAIANARLFRQVQHLAITDPLTNLHNRRYFFEAARQELDRAQRYRRPLSLIMLDIDHFKTVNDTYGHQAGDRVLVTVAARCLEKLRGVDISGRYGGEEFVFLLPETNIDHACQVAGRMQAVLMEKPIDIGDEEIMVSVSLGLAEIGEGCTDLQALIRRADQALYVTKDTGRGRITAWAEEMGKRR